MQLGFIGLGTMGRQMARNLIAGGHAMAVFARRATSAQPLVDVGATFCASPAAVAEQSDVIFTMVTGTSDVQQVVLGGDEPGTGVVDGARPGSLVIDMSTIDPTATRAMAKVLAARGVDMLDAPVSGGPQGAADASLTIMVGGPVPAFERARPLFALLGTTVTHLGASGAGHTTKACHQLALLVTAQGAAEALTLAGRCGLDVEQVRKVLMGGVASSRVLDLFGTRMASRDFSAGIESRLYHKDMDIALSLAHDRGAVLPAAAVTMQSVNGLMGRGRGRDDLSALITVLEDAAGGATPDAPNGSKPNE
ncbi:MAG: NAD(P)-dependent oxidoreductase [Vicinamibacterales bacterium]|jgi:2-hydroxy-3-oxopropionate reductase|nr:NAD(P)-dependent oxidoreductase [Vicinamibacterales bacterium]